MPNSPSRRTLASRRRSSSRHCAPPAFRRLSLGIQDFDPRVQDIAESGAKRRTSPAADGTRARAWLHQHQLRSHLRTAAADPGVDRANARRCDAPPTLTGSPSTPTRTCRGSSPASVDSPSRTSRREMPSAPCMNVAGKSWRALAIWKSAWITSRSRATHYHKPCVPRLCIATSWGTPHGTSRR